MNSIARLTLRRNLMLVWHIVVPGLALLVALRADRRDGRPDYVLPWVIFAAIVGAAWTVPVPGRAKSASWTIPYWVWPWLALAGVLLYR